MWTRLPSPLTFPDRLARAVDLDPVSARRRTMRGLRTAARVRGDPSGNERWWNDERQDWRTTRQYGQVGPPAPFTQLLVHDDSHVQHLAGRVVTVGNITTVSVRAADAVVNAKGVELWHG